MCDANTECYWSLKYERAKEQIVKLENALELACDIIGNHSPACPPEKSYDANTCDVEKESNCKNCWKEYFKAEEMKDV